MGIEIQGRTVALQRETVPVRRKSSADKFHTATCSSYGWHHSWRYETQHHSGRGHAPTQVRSYSDEVRAKILDSLEKMAAGIAIANGLPPDRTPIVSVSKTETTPVTYNDPALAARLHPALIAALGAVNVVDWHA